MKRIIGSINMYSTKRFECYWYKVILLNSSKESITFDMKEIFCMQRVLMGIIAGPPLVVLEQWSANNAPFIKVCMLSLAAFVQTV